MLAHARSHLGCELLNSKGGCCRQYTGRFGDLSTGAVFIFSGLAYFHLIHQTFTISYQVCNLFTLK